ncbi:hypothetical protein B7494_g5915 [Chlorociboria aeruginascens]|nr:hypothetical protein B7494_g5915 [Chlorociboria aeruginascens]
MNIIQRSNDALNINPPSGDTYHLSVHGSDWLWAVTAIYLFSFLIVVGLSYFARTGERIFHYLFTISLFVGGIAYFAMASDLGSTPVLTSSNSTGTREIFYARYINWFVGWPPLIITIGLISGVSWATIVYDVILSWIWVSTWLSGALIATHYKWGFFAFGLIAYFLLAASFLHIGSITAKRIGITRHYTGISGWLVFLWLLYPIAYGVDDGGNKISVTSGFIFFGILDVLTVPLLSFAVLFLSRTWDYRALNIYFTQYGRVAQAGDFPEREKAAPEATTTTTATPAASAPAEQTV